MTDEDFDNMKTAMKKQMPSYIKMAIASGMKVTVVQPSIIIAKRKKPRPPLRLAEKQFNYRERGIITGKREVGNV